MFKRPFILISVTLLLSGCPNPPKNNHASSHAPTIQTAQPQWVLQPPNDSQQTLYGSGQGINRQQAIQNALADLSSRLGVKVSSQFQTTLSVQKRGYELTKRDTHQQVNTEVAPIEINQYQVVETYAPLPTTIYVLIKSNKQLLAKSLQDKLLFQVQHYQSLKKQFAQKGHLQRYLFSLKESHKLPKFRRTLFVLKTLTPGANFLMYNQYIKQVETTLLTQKKYIRFQIVPLDYASQLFVSSIKDTLSADHLLAPQANAIQIRLTTQANKTRAYGFYINRYQIHLTVWDHQTQINGLTINIKGQSGQNSQVSDIQAQARFKKAFDLQKLLDTKKPA